MSLNISKDNTNNWKAKAISRNKIISQQKKIILELKESREKWKAKCKVLKSTLSGFEKSDSFLDENTKAKGHYYAVPLVLFCVQFLSYGAQSLRGCVHTLLLINLCFGLRFKKNPCHTTIRNWACKMGYYRLLSAEKSKEPWVIFVDESISIGNEKNLLILGIPTSKLHFKEGLTLSEMRVLSMDISPSWKAENIYKILRKVAENYPIDYVVSDCGANLKSSYALGKYLHIPDCTHIMANILSDLYEKDVAFISFCKQCGLLRQKWVLSKNAKFMPPSQRGKVRFANLFTVIEWAKNNLNNWLSLPNEVKEELSFLKENTAWINEFYAIQTQSLALQKTLKISGYSEKIHEEISTLLEQYNEDAYKKQVIFKEKTMAYLAILSAKKPKEQEKLYCSSDIIESAFGKLKQKINPHSPQKMTVFVLTLASIGSAYSIEEVRKGLETVKEKDLKNYRNPPKTGGKTG